MSAANDNAAGAKISYSYKEAVAATGCSRNTLSRMVADGLIQARHRGRRVFIPRAELERHFGPIARAS